MTFPPAAQPALVSAAAPAQHTSQTARPEQERWAAWHARGAAHDRAVRRRMPFVLAIVTVAIIALVTLLTQ